MRLVFFQIVTMFITEILCGMAYMFNDGKPLLIVLICSDVVLVCHVLQSLIGDEV